MSNESSPEKSGKPPRGQDDEDPKNVPPAMQTVSTHLNRMYQSKRSVNIENDPKRRHSELENEFDRRVKPKVDEKDVDTVKELPSQGTGRTAGAGSVGTVPVDTTANPVVSDSIQPVELDTQGVSAETLPGPSSENPDSTLCTSDDEVEFIKRIVHPKFIFPSPEFIEHVEKILTLVRNQKMYKDIGIASPKGLLISGPPGCGKSLLAKTIAWNLEWTLIEVPTTELRSDRLGGSEKNMREKFAEAVKSPPCVILLDDIDIVAQTREESVRDIDKRLVTQLAAIIDDLFIQDVEVLVIGTTSKIDVIDPTLRRFGRFDSELSVGIPNIKTRAKIMEKLCRDVPIKKNVDYTLMAELTPGYVGADLKALINKAAIAAVDPIVAYCKVMQSSGGVSASSTAKHDIILTMSHFEAALKNTTPSSKREGFITVPNVKWDDIGALQNVKRELEVSILGPVKFAREFDALGLNRPAGVLLCGPPGCGKTLVAKAVANEARVNFISVKGPELLNMYVGESEKGVRQCFTRAKNSAPCVVFFDEIDALCARRSDSEVGSHSSRLVNQLLTEMDGIESRQGVFIMAATNRPDMIDPAVLRPGRLDKVLYVGFPDADGRLDILKALTKDSTKPPLDDDVDLSVIAGRLSDNYTGADLSAIVREAAIICFRELVLEAADKVAPEKLKVSRRHFEQAVVQVKSSVCQKEREKYDRFRKEYASQ